MSNQFAKLTGSPGDWSLPVVDRGPIKRYADSSIGPLSLLKLDATDRLNRFGLVPVRNVYDFDSRTHTKTGQTEALVGLEWLVTETGTLKPDDALRTLRETDIESQRDAVLAGPIGFDIDGTTYPVSMTDRSQFRMTVADRRAGNNPAWNRTWVMADGQVVSMTNAQIKAMYAAAEAHVDAVFDNFVTHLAALKALTGQAILDYDITTGWPTIYEAP